MNLGDYLAAQRHPKTYCAVCVNLPDEVIADIDTAHDDLRAGARRIVPWLVGEGHTGVSEDQINLHWAKTKQGWAPPHRG